MTSFPFMAVRSEPISGKSLDSWKEIAAFFGRAERTVKRWEAERGLPVHRVPGGGRSAVFAYTNELADWLKGRSEELDTEDSASGEVEDTKAEIAVGSTGPPTPALANLFQSTCFGPACRTSSGSNSAESGGRKKLAAVPSRRLAGSFSPVRRADHLFLDRSQRTSDQGSGQSSADESLISGPLHRP